MSLINRLYKEIYWLGILIGLCACCLLFFHLKPMVSGAMICLLMLAAIILLKSLIQVSRYLPGKARSYPLWAGVFIIVGGVIFDMANTIFFSPDLSREANPIVRILLNNQFSLTQIYAMGLFCQTVYVAILSILWANFLKAYPLLLQQITKRSLVGVAVTIFGGPKASGFDVMIGKVDCFFHVTSLTPMLVGVSLYRWYLGLEWLEWVPISRVFVPVGLFVFSLICYVYMSYQALHKRYIPYLPSGSR